MRIPISLLGVLALASSATVLLCQVKRHFAGQSLTSVSVEAQIPVKRSVPSVTAPAPPAQTHVSRQIPQLPLTFEVNRGQAGDRVKFLSRSPNHTLFLTPTEAIIDLPILVNPPFGTQAHTLPAFSILSPKSKIGNPRSITLRMRLAGGNPRALVSGIDELPGKVNYLVGSDRGQWKTGIRTFAKVKYQGVYSGIDLVYYGKQGHLEYDFIIAPGADPRVITMNFEGAGWLEVDDNGDLVLKAGSRSLRQQKPVIYQEVQGRRHLVPGEYVLKGPRQVGFRIDPYDASKPLVIDPVLSFSSYLGGQGGDRGYGIALDPAGNVYITGETRSANFPTMNALQLSHGGDRNDAFVTKLNPSGTAILYSTYLGGSGGETGYDIAVDSTGNAYVTGTTYSTNFPTTPGALQRTIAGGDESFITKLNAEGNALVYSTFLGGSGGDDASGIALDSAGNAYVTGGTDSANFPTTTGAFQRTKGAGQSEDAFVTKINPQGSALVYSTFLGSSEPEGGFGIAVDVSGSAYVTGTTLSPTFPTTPGALQATYAGGEGDAFVAKLNPEGSALAYSTFLGGTSVDLGFRIAVDASGNAFFTGVTVSTNFPTANPLQSASAGRDETFVTKLNSSGTALLYSSYLGGDNEDAGFDIAIDGLGNAYVTGTTTSTNFPLSNPLQSARSGNRDAFVTKLNPNGSTLVYSTYLGGSDLDYGQGIALDSNSNAYVTGRTFSPDFPTSASAAQPLYTGTLNPSFGNSSQAFVAKISEGTALFVPAVVSTSGASNSFFTSELVLTNRGSSQATVSFAYTAAFGGGSGTATDTFTAGEQKIIPDAISYLRSIGIPIPDSGNRGGTLAVRYSASGGAVTVRTTTAVSGGRAGLAYAGIATAFRAPVYLCGLRQNASDRSNVAVQNLGSEGDGNIVLRLTVFSGDPGTPVSKALTDVTLPPGGFAQLNSVLTSEGLSLSHGYVRIERVGGKAPFYAYAVINDQGNSDGSFVPPLPEGGLYTIQTLTLPVIVETSAFESELVITNLSASARTIRFQYVADANSTPDSTVRFELSLPAHSQQILPGLVQYLRSIGVPGIGPRGGSYAGALFATAVDGYLGGVFVGARTSAPGGGGRYGLFYPAVPTAASTSSSWIFGLQQNLETRSNLALVNTGEVDSDLITLNVELFDGSTGTKVSTIEGVSLRARGWTQLVTLLGQHAPGVTQGYARVTRVAGSNPFIAYAVINDGGQPGERTGDGAFVAGSP